MGVKIRHIFFVFLQGKQMAKIRPYLGRDSLASVVHALLTSKLDYCNTLYMGLPLKMVRKLQLVQKAAVRVITGTRRFEHIRLILARLHWLPIHVSKPDSRCWF